MQLSEDGKFMWNGTEWIANPDASSTAPVVLSANVAQIASTAPSTMIIGHIDEKSTSSIINFSSALSVYKYGFLSILGGLASFIILSAVWGITYAVLGSDSGIFGLIVIFIALLVSVIGYGQLIIYPVGVALKDGRSDSVSFGYMDSWKTSFAGFVESVAVISIMGLVLGLGVHLESMGLMIIGGIAWFLFMIGYIPYMVRKAAEIMN
jgi:hypothetical protein